MKQEMNLLGADVPCDLLFAEMKGSPTAWGLGHGLFGRGEISIVLLAMGKATSKSWDEGSTYKHVALHPLWILRFFSPLDALLIFLSFATVLLWVFLVAFPLHLFSLFTFVSLPLDEVSAVQIFSLLKKKTSLSL